MDARRDSGEDCMPIYQIRESGLVGLARVKAGDDLYEKDIEDLLWNSLESFVGEDLFPVARQSKIRTGGIPDVIALDAGGRVVVIEGKRSIERTQLAPVPRVRRLGTPHQPR
jgi:hypothetical protein